MKATLFSFFNANKERLGIIEKYNDILKKAVEDKDYKVTSID